MKMRKKTSGMYGRKDDYGMRMGKESKGTKKKSAKSKRGGY